MKQYIVHSEDTICNYYQDQKYLMSVNNKKMKNNVVDLKTLTIIQI